MLTLGNSDTSLANPDGSLINSNAFSAAVDASPEFPWTPEASPDPGTIRFPTDPIRMLLQPTPRLHLTTINSTQFHRAHRHILCPLELLSSSLIPTTLYSPIGSLSPRDSQFKWEAYETRWNYNALCFALCHTLPQWIKDILHLAPKQTTYNGYKAFVTQVDQHYWEGQSENMALQTLWNTSSNTNWQARATNGTRPLIPTNPANLMHYFPPG
ncbi:hypothetical protein E4T56_gene1867 [Termitomyces sp. T112]|nr:hypothetical protein E4T56_gene1867 [Termitomyces sp. T112]